MIKVAVIDDYQNAFQQIVDIEKYKDKFDFKVFNRPFAEEKEAIVELVGPAEHEIINLRPGEKMHEMLLNRNEIPYAKDLGDRYVLLDPQTFAKDNLFGTSEIIEKYKDVKSTNLQNEYSSDDVELMTKEELKSMLRETI